VIKNVCNAYLDKDKIKESLKDIEFKDDSSKIKCEITNLEVINKKLNENLDKSYIDNLKGIIDDEQYARISKLLKQEINANKEKIDNLKAMNVNDSKQDNRQIENYINEFLSLENPTRELIINLIEKIEIYDDKTIDINLTFNNDFIL